MFFNRGEFIPSATVTDRAQARTPDAAAERIDDSTIKLTFAVSGGPDQYSILSSTIYSWDEDSGTVIAEDIKPAADETVGGDVNGRWCPTPESNDRYGCLTIALPTATYDNGDARELIEQGDLSGDGGTSYMFPNLPFGTFYPAGTPIALPDYYQGADLPNQDRIWNGQTGTLLVRQ